MTMEYDSEVEEATNVCSRDDETDIDVFLRVTPLLTFSSGPEPSVGDDGVGSEGQKPVNLQKVYGTHSGHNYTQTNCLSSDDNNVEKLAESKKVRAKKFKLDRSTEVNAELPDSPESSPTSGRNHRMALIRSLSSSAPAAPKEVSPKQTRRLSDPTVHSEKGLVKNFERQASLKKLRPYLKRKVVSPLHLLGKVAASSGSKHNNNDLPQNKEPKGTKVGLAKRLYPSFNKAHLSQKAERRGSDPPGVPSKEDKCSLGNGYETMINDFSNQIQDLAFNLENLTTSDHTRNELAASSHMKTNRQQFGEPDQRDSGTRHFFKDDDIRLQAMLEQVLKSQLLTMDDYSPTSCDQASRSISKITARLLGGGHRQKQPSEGQRKVACLVYIGAIRDSGIQMAAQAMWRPDEDNFAAASFRNESVCGFAVVIATPAF